MDNIRREYEVAPGIYLTPPSSAGDPGSHSEPQPVSPEAYIESLRAQGLLIEPVVAAEVKRLESLIGKLEDTNEELRLEGDCELMEVVRENEGVVRKYRRMIEMMEREVGLAPGVYL